MKKITLLSLLSLLLHISLSAQSPLQQFIDNPALKHASVGVHVIDLSTGKTIVSHDSEKSLTPASIAKIITTATSLEVLGEDYRYETKVGLDVNIPYRINVLGSGDPTLGSSAFGTNPSAFFLNVLSAANRELDVDKEYEIIVVDNLFGYDGVSPEWTWIDLGNYYAPGSYGVSIYDNTYKMYLDSKKPNATPNILRTEPYMHDLRFTNLLTLNTTGSDNAYIYGAPFSNYREVRGNIPAGRESFIIKGDIPNPGLLLGQTLADYLASSGINVTNIRTTRDDYLDHNKKDYPIIESLHTQLSPPLKEIIREINVKSNNHYAEHLIRTIGTVNGPNEDALQSGIDFVNKFWNQKGVSTTSMSIYDGSGLAPKNAFSSQFLTDILVYMYGNSKYSKSFIDSLPKAGREGTLKNFLKGSKYDGKIIAKSGSIGGVHCYSGYLLDGNKKYAFTVMVNKFNGTRPQVRSAIEKFLLSL